MQIQTIAVYCQPITATLAAVCGCTVCDVAIIVVEVAVLRLHYSYMVIDFEVGWHSILGSQVEQYVQLCSLIPSTKHDCLNSNL